jgi:hypothetical protein
VRERRAELGILVDEAFVPLLHDPAAEAEIDWGPAEVCLGGERRTIHLFLMRSCFSGACFCQAFARETQQAFLEGHVGALQFFGGAFQTVRYDNLRSAVAKVLKGRRRVEADRFVALRSHYLFSSEFTRRDKEGAHEKGGVNRDQGLGVDPGPRGLVAMLCREAGPRKVELAGWRGLAVSGIAGLQPTEECAETNSSMCSAASMSVAQVLMRERPSRRSALFKG